MSKRLLDICLMELKWNLFEKVLISLLCKFMNGYIFKLFRMCFGYKESCFKIIVFF